jgi:hypothetical protein
MAVHTKIRRTGEWCIYPTTLADIEKLRTELEDAARTYHSLRARYDAALAARIIRHRKETPLLYD